MVDSDQQQRLLGKIAAYSEVLAQDPRATVFVSLGECYRKLGLYNDTCRVIRSGLRYHQEMASAHVVLARALFQQDKSEESIDSFKKALALDPENMAALVGLARVRLELKKPHQARVLLLQARSLNPADKIVNKLLQELPDDQPKGPPVTVSAANDSPAQAASLVSVSLGDLYRRQGHYEQALEIYQQIALSRPDDKGLQIKIAALTQPAAQPSAAAAKTLAAPDAVEEDNAAQMSQLETLNRWLGNLQRLKEPA